MFRMEKPRIGCVYVCVGRGEGHRAFQIILNNHRYVSKAKNEVKRIEHTCI